MTLKNLQLYLTVICMRYKNIVSVRLNCLDFPIWKVSAKGGNVIGGQSGAGGWGAK